MSGIGALLLWTSGTMSAGGITTISGDARMIITGELPKDLNRELDFDGNQFGVDGGDLRMNNAKIVIRQLKTAQFSSINVKNTSGNNELHNDGTVIINSGAVTSFDVPFVQGLSSGSFDRPPVVIQPGGELHVGANSNFKGLAGQLGGVGGKLIFDVGNSVINGITNLDEVEVRGSSTDAQFSGETRLNATKLRPGAKLELTGHLSTNVLQMDENSLVKVNGNGNSVLTVGSLPLAALDPTATIDIGRNGLILTQFTVAQLQAQVSRGYAGGSWMGRAITSTDAQQQATIFGVGYAQASAFGFTSFLGVPVQPGDAVARFTRYGDANLDGVVNNVDFNQLAGNFNRTERVWTQGDFTYDGTVNNADFDRLAANFNKGTLLTALFATRNPILATGTLPHTAVAADLNSDGRPEIVAVNQGLGQGVGQDASTVSIFLNQSTTAAVQFPLRRDFAVGLLPVSVAVGDFNGDNKPDLAVANAAGNAGLFTSSISVLINQTNAGSSDVSFAPAMNFATADRPRFVVAADFNGDSKLDLASANFFADNVSVLINTSQAGTTNFAPKQDFPTGVGPLGLAAADFNRDGKIDLAAVNQTSSNVSILLNGTGLGGTTASFSAPQNTATGSGPRFVVAGDLNDDGAPDLATTNEVSGTVSVLLNTTPALASSTSFVKQDFAVGVGPIGLAIGYIDSDNKLDLAASNFGANTVSVLLNATASGAASSTFVPIPSLNVGANPIFVAIKDLNGDQKSDLAVADYSSNTISVLINIGNATPLQASVERGADVWPQSDRFDNSLSGVLPASNAQLSEHKDDIALRAILRATFSTFRLSDDLKDGERERSDWTKSLSPLDQLLMDKRSTVVLYPLW